MQKWMQKLEEKKSKISISPLLYLGIICMYVL